MIAPPPPTPTQLALSGLLGESSSTTSQKTPTRRHKSPDYPDKGFLKGKYGSDTEQSPVASEAEESSWRQIQKEQTLADRRRTPSPLTHTALECQEERKENPLHHQNLVKKRRGKKDIREKETPTMTLLMKVSQINQKKKSAVKEGSLLQSMRTLERSRRRLLPLHSHPRPHSLQSGLCPPCQHSHLKELKSHRGVSSVTLPLALRSHLAHKDNVSSQNERRKLF